MVSARDNEASDGEKTQRNLRGQILIFFVGLIVWFLQLLVSYVLSSLACGPWSTVAFLVLAALAALIALAAIAFGFRALRRKHGKQSIRLIDTDQRISTASFVGIAGMILNGYFVALIIFTGVSATFFSPCPFISMPLP